MRLIFMGTPDFSVPILEALHAHHFVAAVYTQPPRSAGRGQKARPSAVAVKATSLGLPVFSPKSLKRDDVQRQFRDHAADSAVVAAYGLILPQAVLDAPRLGCLNVHASLLPRWRGAAPIQRAVMAGDTESGITIMQMDAGLDTGAMLLKNAVPVDHRTTAGSLHDALAGLGAKLIVEALSGVEAGHLLAAPQPEEGVTYADKIDKAEALIDFNRPAHEVLCHIHGLSPFPGAHLELDGKRLKLLSAELIIDEDESRAASSPGTTLPGTILDDQFTIACAKGAIRPLRLQRAGKSSTDAPAFLRGFELRPGTRVG